jgi:hypothetical protein
MAFRIYLKMSRERSDTEDEFFGTNYASAMPSRPRAPKKIPRRRLTLASLSSERALISSALGECQATEPSKGAKRPIC